MFFYFKYGCKCQTCRLCVKRDLLLHRCKAVTCIPVLRKARCSTQLHLFISCLYLHFKDTVRCPSALVSTAMYCMLQLCKSDSRCQFISFSSLYFSCLPLLAEGFDRYLPSSEFLFSVWEWFLQHIASLIYLKYRERSVHACYVKN